MKKIVFAVAIVAMFSGRASADLYWDTNGPTPGASAGTTASGTWDTTTANWTTDSTGASATQVWSTTQTAVFSAGNNATGKSVIGGSATAAGLVIEEGTVEFTGTITMGANPITVQSGAVLETNSSLRISTSAGSTVTLNGGTLRTTNAGAAGTFFDPDSEIVLGPGGGTLSHTTANILNIVQTATKITGTGSLTKTGAGVLAIASTAGNNTYSGGTIVNEGELRMRTVVNTLPTTTAVTVNSPGIFNLNGVSTTIGSLSGNGNVGTGAGTLTIDGPTSTTFNGALKNIANAGAGAVTTGNGRLIKNGSGTITFNGLNDINGSVTLNAGGIIVSPGASLSGSIADLTVNGGTLTLNNAAQTVENLASTAAGGTIVLGAGHVLTTDPVASTAYTGTITGPGGLVKANALSATTRRTLTLSGNNSYDGSTVITGGIISVQHANALGSPLGYTEVNATSPLGAEVLFTGANGSVTTSEPFRIAGAGSTNGGAISVTGGATPTLSGPVALIGDATIAVASTSSLTLNNPAAITSLENQNLTLQGGSGAGAGGTVSGAINLGTGSLVKAQGGTWRLNAPAGNAYSGGTNINDGTLIVNNTTGSGTGSGPVTVAGDSVLGGTGTIAGPVTVTANGTVAPGESPGTLTINNTFVLNPASTLAYELNGANQTVGGGVNDLITGVTDLTLDGTLNVAETVAGSFLSAMNGDTWRLITYTGMLVNNGLELGTMPALAAGKSFVIDTSTLGQINLAVVPEAGAFAAMGIVGLLSAGAVWLRKRRLGQATV